MARCISGRSFTAQQVQGAELAITGEKAWLQVSGRGLAGAKGQRSSENGRNSCVHKF